MAMPHALDVSASGRSHPLCAPCIGDGVAGIAIAAIALPPSPSSSNDDASVSRARYVGCAEGSLDVKDEAGWLSVFLKGLFVRPSVADAARSEPSGSGIR